MRLWPFWHGIPNPKYPEYGPEGEGGRSDSGGTHHLNPWTFLQRHGQGGLDEGSPKCGTPE